MVFILFYCYIIMRFVLFLQTNSFFLLAPTHPTKPFKARSCSSLVYIFHCNVCKESRPMFVPPTHSLATDSAPSRTVRATACADSPSLNPVHITANNDDDVEQQVCGRRTNMSREQGGVEERKKVEEEDDEEDDDVADTLIMMGAGEPVKTNSGSNRTVTSSSSRPQNSARALSGLHHEDIVDADEKAKRSFSMAIKTKVLHFTVSVLILVGHKSLA